MRRLDGLQHLRAVAALGVVAFHAGARYGLHQPIGPWDVDFWGLGERGVDIFFVLSGFLLWTTTSARPPRNPGAFLWARFKRLAPPYWLATGALACAALFTGLYPHLTVEPLHVLSSLFFWPMLSPSHPPAIWPLLVPGWTLNYEMAFYVLFAAVLLVPATRRLLVLAAAVGVLLLAGLIPVLPVPIDFWTRPLIVEFLFGVGIGAIWTSGRRHGVPVAAALLSIGALALIFAPWVTHRSLMSGVPA
ncbi:MAG TPA: acyltransferase, partial [Caulobacteraceae bacterium]